MLNPPSPEGTLSQIAPKTPAHPREHARSVRRDMLFRETLRERCERVLLGVAWSLQSTLIDRLLPITRLWIQSLFEPGLELLDLSKMPGAGELVGIASDLSAPTLLRAYARGLFPHSHCGPPKWMSPPERCVLFFENFHMSKRLKRLMRQGRYTVTFDQDFEGVIKACAGNRGKRFHLTWITPHIMRAYAALFDAGYVHSFEVWNAEGKLVGGGYGVALGQVFSTNPSSRTSRIPRRSASRCAIGTWRTGAMC